MPLIGTKHSVVHSTMQAAENCWCHMNVQIQYVKASLLNRVSVLPQRGHHTEMSAPHRHSSQSLSESFAVIAMMGTFRPLVRSSLVALMPDIIGIAISIRITSKAASWLLLRTMSTASIPFATTVHFNPRLVNIFWPTVWLTKLSSASKTRRPCRHNKRAFLIHDQLRSSAAVTPGTNDRTSAVRMLKAPRPLSGVILLLPTSACLAKHHSQTITRAVHHTFSAEMPSFCFPKSRWQCPCCPCPLLILSVLVSVLPSYRR